MRIANAQTGETDVDGVQPVAKMPTPYDDPREASLDAPAATKSHKPPAVKTQSDQLFANDPLLFTEKLLAQLRDKDGRGKDLKVSLLPHHPPSPPTHTTMHVHTTACPRAHARTHHHHHACPSTFTRTRRSKKLGCICSSRCVSCTHNSSSTLAE